MGARRRKLRRRWLINPSQIRIRRYNKAFARTITPEMLVLDAGAGKAPYRALFQHAQYETADFMQLDSEYAPMTYVCDLREIPVEDARFDRIVFNQVLEHVPDPRAVLAELARVTKDDGRILCSCPLTFPPHNEPYDFYRYTEHALRMLFDEADFQVKSVEWAEGYFATVAMQLHQMSKSLPPSLRGKGLGASWLLAGPLVAFVRFSSFWLAGFFARLDLRWKVTTRGYPKNYVVRAHRRARADVASASEALAVTPPRSPADAHDDV